MDHVHNVKFHVLEQFYTFLSLILGMKSWDCCIKSGQFENGQKYKDRLFHLFFQSKHRHVIIGRELPSLHDIHLLHQLDCIYIGK